MTKAQRINKIIAQERRIRARQEELDREQKEFEKTMSSKQKLDMFEDALMIWANG